MLNGLHDIDWENLHHAYGPAIDTPWHIRALTSVDGGVREYALIELHQTIWHQGTVYEVTSYAIPFLILLLSQPKIQGKDRILGLLACCARGNPAYTEFDEWYKTVCVKEGKDFNQEVEQSQIVVKRAKDAVQAGIPQYVSLLEHPDKKIRLSAVEVLTTQYDNPEIVLPAIRRCLFQEDNVVNNAQMLRLLGNYLDENTAITDEDISDFLLNFAISVNHPPFPQKQSERVLQFANAMEYIHLLHRRVDTTLHEDIDGALPRILLGAITNPRGLDPVFRESDIGDRNTVERSVQAMFKLSNERSAQLLCDALASVKNPEHAHLIAIALWTALLNGQPMRVRYSGDTRIKDQTIYYDFKDPELPIEKRTLVYPIIIQSLDLAQLTEIQKSAILTVLNTKIVWRLKSNLLEAFGLPNDRTKLVEQLQSNVH